MKKIMTGFIMMCVLILGACGQSTQIVEQCPEEYAMSRELQEYMLSHLTNMEEVQRSMGMHWAAGDVLNRNIVVRKYIEKDSLAYVSLNALGTPEEHVVELMENLMNDMTPEVRELFEDHLVIGQLILRVGDGDGNAVKAARYSTATGLIPQSEWRSNQLIEPTNEFLNR